MTRIAVLVVRQETNSFVSGETTLDKFVDSGLFVGDEMLVPGRDTYIDGFRDTLCAELPGAVIVPVVRAATVAGPPISDDALARLIGHVRDGLEAAGPVDAVLAALHGAFVTGDGQSADARIAAEIRRLVGPAVPVVVGLDHHGWITPPLVDSVDVLVAHRTQPHDLYDTAVEAARLLVARLRRGVRPRIVLERIPMLTHQERFPTATEPMAGWFERARELERHPAIWSISTFPMQPWLDVSSAGWTVVVVGDADDREAERAAAELADHAWTRRDEFSELSSQSPTEAVCAAVSHARQAPGLAVLADVGDAVFAGAHGDSTELLRLLLAHDLPAGALVPVADPVAASACHALGVGASISVTLGGKLSGCEPAAVHGVVRAVSSGRIALPGFIHETTDLGRCALLDCAAAGAAPVQVMVSERAGVSGNHPRVYERLGVEVSAVAIAVLKSAANVQGFARFDPVLFPAGTSGSTQSDLRSLPWRRRPRPLFPFEDITSRTAPQ